MVERRPSLLALLMVALLLAAALLFGACGDDDEDAAPSPAAPSPAARGTGAAQTSSPQPPSASAADCGLTAATTEGPYYVTGTRALEDGDLNYADLPGEPIRISGHVYAGEEGSQPVAGARIEIWQTDADGAYHPEGSGDAADYGDGEVALRGYVVTDESGAYTFSSVYPGYYEGRTRHIHVRVSGPGVSTLATQIIVPPRPGDGTTPDADGIAQALPDCNHVRFSEQDGAQAATFDLRLAAE
jgi:protocatechuate 3,4-dioxygenase beta subunit